MLQKKSHDERFQEVVMDLAEGLVELIRAATELIKDRTGDNSRFTKIE